MCNSVLVQKGRDLRLVGGLSIVEVDSQDRARLFELGFHDCHPNTTIDHYPSEPELQEAAYIFTKYYGRITAYHLFWHIPIGQWRIVYGN